MTVPRTIHQLWIGDASLRPTKLMETWAAKHPSYTYIMWNEAEIERRLALGKAGADDSDATFAASYARVETRVGQIEEINGKADILRWVILYAYGGVFCDADSICIEAIDGMLDCRAFAGYENERVRGPGWSPNFPEIHSHKHALIALGCVGFVAGHPIAERALEWIERNPVSTAETRQRAWYTVGPGLITRVCHSENLQGTIVVHPSHLFLPHHYTGDKYRGHDRVFAYQEWGSTKRSYARMSHELPADLAPPARWVSVLVSSYNTRASHVSECLASIRSQTGHVGIEVVWIDDGSDGLHAAILAKSLAQFERRSRFVTVVHSANGENHGVGYSLNRGIALCSHDVIIKMDSDDVMHPSRIEKQLAFMQNNPQCAIVGCQLEMFRDGDGRAVNTTSHPTVSWVAYRLNPTHWIANHPTLCYRKSAVLQAGGYSAGDSGRVADDFEFEVRMLKAHGHLHNMPDVLLRYRLHEGQVTHKERGRGAHWNDERMKIIHHHTQPTPVTPFEFLHN